MEGIAVQILVVIVILKVKLQLKVKYIRMQWSRCKNIGVSGKGIVAQILLLAAILILYATLFTLHCLKRYFKPFGHILPGFMTVEVNNPNVAGGPNK